MSIEAIELWHKRARPEPTFETFNVQLGCHFEEIAEMLVALAGEDGVTQNKLSELGYQIMGLAEGFKSGKLKAYASQREEFLDSLVDQIVTGVGVAYCDGMKITQAVGEVNKSNWSKFDHEGKPYFDDNGKIKKGPNYIPPKLEGMA
jgi:predicted HAD superfamily Cof-like phosphohydrolase